MIRCGRQDLGEWPAWAGSGFGQGSCAPNQLPGVGFAAGCWIQGSLAQSSRPAELVCLRRCSYMSKSAMDPRSHCFDREPRRSSKVRSAEIETEADYLPPAGDGSGTAPPGGP